MVSEILAKLDELRDRRYQGTVSEIDYHTEWDRLWYELQCAHWIEERRQERLEKIAVLKGAGLWYHKLFPTVQAAREAGYRDMEPEQYGGEIIFIKGHKMIRNPETALSESVWERSHKCRVIPSQRQSPHAVLKNGYITYPVYRANQVEPIPRKAKIRDAKIGI